ncbi:MAG: hypothetical protein RLZZ15_3295 [Verrucomicrobiota bacterium]
MKTPDPHLRRLSAGAAPRRTSSELRTPLLIAAGLIGVPLAIGLAYHASQPDDDGDTEGAPPAPSVNANTDYPMNHFLPGAGYYHAPYRSWFPFPFNYHDSGRGWFRGGQWQPTADATDAEKRAQSDPRTSGFATTTTNSGGGVGAGARAGNTSAFAPSSRPTPDAVQRANQGAATHHKSNIMRGGFGSSSRPGIS